VLPDPSDSFNDPSGTSQWIHELARRFIEAVRNARIHMSSGIQIKRL